MAGFTIAIVVLALAAVTSLYRMLAGPTDADRAVSADLVFFGIVGLIALVGVRFSHGFTADLVVIAALVGFLSALSLARALTRGKR